LNASGGNPALPKKTSSLRIGPPVFALFAVTHLVIGLLALTLIDAAPLAAVCFFVVEFITFYDNLIVAAGNRLGVNSLNKKLNWTRFFFHGTMISLLLPVYSEIARLSGVGFFQAPFSQTGIGVLVIAIAVLGFLLGFLRVDVIMPVNYFGCLRYAQSVSEITRREDHVYSDIELRARARPPMASILTTVIGLAISLWTGMTATFWLPFVVTAIMFTAASFPIKTWGPLATSLVEIVFSAGICFSLYLVAT
jgi:hypothetical protein